MDPLLVLLCTGLLGLIAMALPGLARHGGAHGIPGHAGAPHLPAQGPAHLPAHAPGPASSTSASGRGFLHRGSNFVPEPRAAFTVAALLGAFGYLLEHAAHLPMLLALLCALLPAVAFERMLMRPLWRLLMRFEGRPSTPLEFLLSEEAVAVTPFRNGRGIVQVTRDGRAVQLSAELLQDQLSFPVRVGDKLRVVDVEADGERVSVSVV